MQESLDAMKLALRVLTALTERRDPDAGDAEALRGLAGDTDNRDLDDLACEVIQKAIKRRDQVRKAGRRVQDAITL
jgi:hypothetical protein